MATILNSGLALTAMKVCGVAGPGCWMVIGNSSVPEDPSQTDIISEQDFAVPTSWIEGGTRAMMMGEYAIIGATQINEVVIRSDWAPYPASLALLRHVFDDPIGVEDADELNITIGVEIAI